MGKRTGGAPKGTHCGHCGRSKAAEPEQFRMARRAKGKEPSPYYICKPCEAKKWKAEREVRKADPRVCSVDDCGRQHHAAEMCRRHYNKSLLTDECAFEDCDHPSRPGKLCEGHRRQQRQGRPLAPLLVKRDPSARDALGRKRCRTCDEWLPVEHFYRNTRYSDGLTPRCAGCHRDRTLQRKYGISLTRYKEMLASQGGGCAVCGKTEEANGQLLAVDHDHACCGGEQACGRCVRGLLCGQCNMHLGAVGDSIEHLEAMVAYLRVTSSPLSGRP